MSNASASVDSAITTWLTATIMLRLKRSEAMPAIGVLDERMGQVGKAFIVAKDGGPAVSGDELIAWSRQRMAGFKVPRYVEFLDRLPLNATGKVMKDKLS